MTNKKKISKASKRRLMIFGTISIFFIVYFFFSIAYYGYRIYNLKVDQKNLETKLNSIDKNLSEKTNLVEKLKDPDYLAKYARETYSYSKKDEIIIQRHDNKKEEKLQKKLDIKIQDKYILMFCSLILSLVILYIIIKSKNQKK